jgi:tRNA-2-methylthio-N6-dimethylallyladenosine synthase
MNDIISEAKKMIKEGRNEIILLGQNVNSYKTNQKSKNKPGFAILLEKLNNLDGDFEISFTSNHPKDMSDDVIEAVANLPKVRKEIHLPLQAGSDKILKAMNRPYTTKKYLELVDKLKSRIKNLKLTTDIIVGFPGESEEDFQKTVSIFKKVKYYQAYINKYSPRKGTAAYALGDPIPWSEKKRRWHILNKLINR